MIENKGIAPQESFEILGLSDSRDGEVKIGQFGSGAKMGIILLLREGLNPTVTSDEDVYEFYAKHVDSKLGQFDRVCYRHIDRNLDSFEHSTSYSTGAGEIDWTDEFMAIREFISNALDQSNQVWNRIKVEFVNTVEFRKGHTRIFVPANKAIKDYVNNLGKNFLHVTGKEKVATFKKKTCSLPRLYRQGVFVAEKVGYNSLLDYNGDHTMRIDESRNLDSGSIAGHCTSILNKDHGAMKHVISSIANLIEPTFESQFSSFSLNSTACVKAFYSIYGKSAIVTSSSFLKEQLKHKGLVAIELPVGWCRALENGGVKSASGMINALEAAGIQSRAAELYQRETFDTIWHSLKNEDLTFGKEKPTLEVFDSPLKGGAQLSGYQERNTVYLHIDYIDNQKVVLEEISHYITEASDCCRDFQDFAFKVAARFMANEHATTISSSIDLTEY